MLTQLLYPEVIGEPLVVLVLAIPLGILRVFDLQPALILALLGSVDSLLTSLIADTVTGTHHKPNRELMGLSGSVLDTFRALDLLQQVPAGRQVETMDEAREVARALLKVDTDG